MAYSHVTQAMEESHEEETDFSKARRALAAVEGKKSVRAPKVDSCVSGSSDFEVIKQTIILQ